MTIADPLKDGDFAAYLERKRSQSRKLPEALAEQRPAADARTDDVPRSQSIEDILLHGQEPTDEFIEEWREAERNGVSDAELERQALEQPTADGDAEPSE